jgi:hypothetical protein
VPEAAVVRLPGVERVGRLEDHLVAFGHLDLVGDRCDDPVAGLLEGEKGVVQLVVEDFRPDDPGGPGLGKLDRHGDATSAAPDPTAGGIVHVQYPAGLLRTDAPLAEGKDGAPRDDEEAS